MLLAVIVGLSVLIPYIGAVMVTIPVAIIAYFQWGLTSEFAWLLAAYGIIQALDGNVLVPLLFSEVVNLHPVAIILAILVFGGLWGFWGIFWWRWGYSTISGDLGGFRIRSSFHKAPHRFCLRWPCASCSISRCSFWSSAPPS